VEYLGESSSCHPANEDDSEASPSRGVGETEEVKDSPLIQKMSHTLEVSSVVGVSCDGQIGLLEGCFKRIIVESFGKRGEGLHSTTQQEEGDIGRERVSNSAYEE
jgi:hypothetical protein